MRWPAVCLPRTQWLECVATSVALRYFQKNLSGLAGIGPSALFHFAGTNDYVLSSRKSITDDLQEFQGIIKGEEVER